MAQNISLYGWACLALSIVEGGVLIANRSTPLDASIFITFILLASGTYDNALIGLGSTIGLKGNTLTLLSYVRWIVHWLFVPWLLVPAVALAQRVDVLNNAWALPLAFIAAAVLSFIDVREGLLGNKLRFKPVYFAGTVRLISASESTPPFITIGVSLVLLIISFLIKRKNGDSAFFYGSIVALIGNAIPSSLTGTLPGSLGEALLFFSILRGLRASVI